MEFVQKAIINIFIGLFQVGMSHIGRWNLRLAFVVPEANVEKHPRLGDDH